MGKSGEFYTFDEVLKRLAINESKLKRLVSEGEIRAFREGDQMKFRRSDVDNLDLSGARSEEETGVIDLSASKEESSETLTDDLIFDEGDDLDLTSAEAGMATAEISSQDTFVDEGTGMATEQIPAGATAETEVTEPAKKREKPVRPKREVVEVEEPHDMGWAVLMSVTTIALILALIVVLGIRDSNVGTSHAPEVATKIADTFGTHPPVSK